MWIVDGFEGDMDPDPTYGGRARNYADDNFSNYAGGCNCKSYKYEFATLEDLVTSSVFQEQLGKALAHKQKQIDDLRLELLDILSKNAP